MYTLSLVYSGLAGRGDCNLRNEEGAGKGASRSGV